MFKKLQKEALARVELRANRDSVNWLDAAAAQRESGASWDIRYCPSPTISPTNETFPFYSQRSSSNPDVQISKRIPQEVYEAILSQLETLHSDRLAPGCPTCFMRDLVSLQRTNRTWDKAVRRKL